MEYVKRPSLDNNSAFEQKNLANFTINRRFPKAHRIIFIFIYLSLILEKLIFVLDSEAPSCLSVDMWSKRTKMS